MINNNLPNKSSNLKTILICHNTPSRMGGWSGDLSLPYHHISIGGEVKEDINLQT